MPCIEIADSIVQTGRETLEKVRHDDELDAFYTSAGLADPTLGSGANPLSTRLERPSSLW